MREVFRFFVTRNPGKASPAARAALGVALHGRFEVSSHHARLRALAGDRDAMAAAAAAFVNSPDFLAGIDGLHQRLAAAVSRAAAVDFRLDAIAMRRAVDEFGLDRLVGADNAAFVADWNRTADSITALVLLRRLGVADAPYVAIARTLAALAHAAAAMRDGTAFTAHGVASVFTSPVVLDPTLFRRGCERISSSEQA